jgi:hypothetical protein
MALISVSNNALSNISAVPASIPTGSLTLIKSITASSSASIEFINGTNGVVLDGTYSSYVFSFINIHPQTDAVGFNFNMSTDSGSNYNVVKTTTEFGAYHNETDTSANLGYNGSNDLAQSTSDQRLSSTDLGNGTDECLNGYLQLFNPSSSTYVKHFISNNAYYHEANYSIENFVAGYGNTTSPINAIKFLISSGTFDGIIKMYGVS